MGNFKFTIKTVIKSSYGFKDSIFEIYDML